MYINRSAVAAVALSAALVTPCLAGEAAAQDQELQEVVVTGSRLATGFDMPTPVTMFQAEDLQKTAPNNISESLAQLPSLLGSVTNNTSGQGSGNSGTNGQNLLNLREQGPNRTLVLLDGQRMGVTNVVSSVDINIIPQNLIKRVDIVTGGASASYGSDAVAGVVNFILDDKFQGLKIDVNGGETAYHDVKNGKVSVAFGTALGDRARVVGAAEYFREIGMRYGQVTGRDWFDYPTGAWPNPTPNALPSIVIVPNAKSEFGSYGGTITAVKGCPAGAAGAACNALVNQQFLAGGVLAPFNFGTYHGGFAGGGDGAIVNQPFAPDAKRSSFFLHGEYDLTSDLTLWGQGSYNRDYTLLDSQVASQLTTSQFQIFEGNPYLPTAVSSVFAAAPGTQSFMLTRYDLDFGLQQDLGITAVARFAAGLKGRINERWTWDTTATYQNTHQTLDIRGTVERNLYAAAAAVKDASGNIVCASTLQGLDPGCVPLNLFGSGAVSPAAANYVMGWNDADIYLKQTTYDANVRGDLGDRISLGAGPISVAAGANYRRTTADREVDPLSAITIDGTGIPGFPAGLQGRYGGYQFYNPSPIKGEVHATEGYAELGVPLLKDVTAFKSLAGTLAGRLTDYSQSGTENMWKLGLNWTVNDSVRFRGTISKDTRAPSILELFNTASVTQGRNTVPCSACAGAIRSSGQNITTGNPNLKPENARTYTVGVVLSPSFAPGLQVSADWYKIDINGVIASPGNQQIVDGCYAGNQQYCSFILVNGKPVTTTNGIGLNDFVVVSNPTLNLAKQTTSGVDFDAAYRLGHVGPGDLALRLNAVYALHAQDPATNCPIGTGGAGTELVGSISNICGDHPRLAGRIGATYGVGPLSLFVQERYISAAKINPNYVAGVDITFNNVPAIYYTDVQLTYDFGDWHGGKASAYLNITNFWNRDPPVTTASSRSWIVPTEFGFYDVLGRRFLVGVRYRL
jgi:iron complex outermembrane receptor protein